MGFIFEFLMEIFFELIFEICFKIACLIIPDRNISSKLKVVLTIISAVLGLAVFACLIIGALLLFFSKAKDALGWFLLIFGSLFVIIGSGIKIYRELK